MAFEYIPGGALDKYTNLSTFENTQILCQLTSALKYLHTRTPSIAHRDIKPENILVVERTIDGIYVKFADFGLSKAGDELTTYCGTPFWQAPEIRLKAADPVGAANNIYSVAVDIWSLGVVVASLECDGLPKFKPSFRTDAVTWIRAIQRHVTGTYKKRGGELLWLLIDSMLAEDPDKRSSADYIHDEALKLLRSMASHRSGAGDVGSATQKPPMLSAQSALLRHQFGEVPGDGPRAAVDGFGRRQSKRKRSEPEQSSPLSPTQPFAHSNSVNQRRAISKGPPDHKRSKRDE